MSTTPGQEVRNLKDVKDHDKQEKIAEVADSDSGPYGKIVAQDFRLLAEALKAKAEDRPVAAKDALDKGGKYTGNLIVDAVESVDSITAGKASLLDQLTTIVKGHLTPEQVDKDLQAMKVGEKEMHDAGYNHRDSSLYKEGHGVYMAAFGELSKAAQSGAEETVTGLAPSQKDLPKAPGARPLPGHK